MKGDINKFYVLLDDKLKFVCCVLDIWINCLENVKVCVVLILYMEGVCGVCLKVNDLIVDIFKYGCVFILLGYIGVYEIIMVLFG